MKNTVLYLWWLRHRTGGRSPHRNPVCRPSDRLQQASAWAWFFIALLTIPVVSVTVVPAIVDSWRPPTMRPATAVVERVDEVPPVLGPGADIVHRKYDVGVRWQTSTGALRHGSVSLADAPRPDDTIRVWATDDGDHVAASRPRSTPAVDTVVLVAYAAGAIGLFGYGAHRLLVRRLDKRRLHDWEVDLGRLLIRR